MTATATKTQPAWRAEVMWEKRYYTTLEEAPVVAAMEQPDGATAESAREPHGRGLAQCHPVLCACLSAPCWVRRSDCRASFVRAFKFKRCLEIIRSSR